MTLIVFFEFLNVMSMWSVGANDPHRLSLCISMDGGQLKDAILDENLQYVQALWLKLSTG